MQHSFTFKALSERFRDRVSSDERHLFGEPFISQMAFNSTQNTVRSDASADKFKIRQVFWLLDESGDQISWLNLTLKGMVERKFGYNFLRVLIKDMLNKGVTYTSGAIGYTGASLIGGPALGAVGGMLSGKAGSKAYKNLERGFASKHPEWKIKSLYPSTANIDKAISNAYWQRDNKSLRNNDAPRAALNLALKSGGAWIDKIIPLASVVENVYHTYKASKGMSDEKIAKITALLAQLDAVTQGECGSAMKAFERLGVDELAQNRTQKIYIMAKFKKADDAIITRDKLKRQLASIAHNIEESRLLLGVLEGR